MAEKLMAEGTSGTGSEGIPPSGDGQTNPAGTEGQSLPQVSGEIPVSQGPWFSSEYNPNKLREYEVKGQGDYDVLVDPVTGKEVARALKIVGGSGENEEAPGEPRESPIPGLTAEDVDLFSRHGVTVEDLQQIIAQHDSEAFFQQARPRLEAWRNEPTPEQIAQREAEERAKRIQELEAERETLQHIPPNVTPREQTLLRLRQLSNTAELRNLSGAGGRGGGGGAEALGSSEGEPVPPDLDLEYEASPERGRQIADEIQEQAALLYAGRIEEVDWPKLDRAYMDQRIHTEAARLVKARIRIYEAEEQPPSTGQANPAVNTDRFFSEAENGERQAFRPLGEWLQDYRANAITDWDRFRREVNVYFEEARNVGLLRDLDKKLAIAYRQVQQGIQRKQTSDEIMFGVGRRAGVDPEVREILRNIERIYRIRARTDAGIRNLVGAGELYAEIALDRFADIINNDDPEGITQVDYITNEFQLGQGDEDVARETFWRTTQGWYIEVYAQTEEEFEIAADSYISTLESLTSDPKEILDQSQSFIRVLTQSDGGQVLAQTEKGKAFLNKLTFRIQGRVAIRGADDGNERYANDNYKAYMDYENKDGKGPDRYLEVIEYFGALPAAVLWALDNDPRWEILFSLHGPKGELSDASPAQRARDGSGLYNQLYELLVEEMLGVAIKNKKNLGNLSKFTSDETFASNFDGLFQYGRVPEGRANGDINVIAYQAALAQAPDGKLTPAQLRDKRVRLGKIQLELNDLRGRITKGEKFAKKDGQLYDPSEDSIYELLEDSADARFYQSELAKVRKAVDIAFQIYGALGEKSKRGGGVFKTDRKVDAESREFQYFVPVHMAEKFVQCGVTLTKIKYADNAEIWQGQDYKKWNDAIAQEIRRKNREAGLPELKNFKAQYRTAKVLEAEKTAIAEFKKNGYEAKLYYIDYDKDGKEIVGSRQVMTLKRPKEDPRTGEVIKVNGNVVVEEVPVDFYLANHHIYGNWSGHTYWSYQEEDRHMILSDVTFAKARAIRDGKLRPQDADMWTEQLLIIDPTLKRVRRIVENNEDRERKLTMAAVEDSYQRHERIGAALYEAFFPKYGTPSREIGIYYGLQDFGGFRKTVEHARARAAEDPERFARRGRRLIPYLRIPVSPLSEYLGQGTRGALGAIMMMDAPIYRGAGTFALDKFHAQAEMAFKLYEALFITSKDEQGNIVEPLLLKLTNESDTTLQEFMKKYNEKLPKKGDKWIDAALQQEFCVAVRKSFGRLERYEKLLSTMETMVRNASGAQLLEEVDVLTDDGELDREVERAFRALPDINTQDLTRKDLERFITQAEEILRISEDEFHAKFNSGVDDGINPVIPGIDEGSISVDTGSGRHGARFFHRKFFEIFQDAGKRGGYELYPTERYIYEHLDDEIIFYNPTVRTLGEEGVGRTKMTIKDWLFGKMVPT